MELYEDRIESQFEITRIIEKLDQQYSTIEFSDYVYILENISSDIFIYVKIF
jgi:hypothetical protein